MENKVKHQHYIPQMYLRRFCDQNKQLYAYDIINNRGVRNLPRSFAHEKFFYDIDANTMRELLKEYESLIDPAKLDALSGKQLIEHMLSRIEGEASTVLNGLDSNQLALTNEHVHTVLIVFLKTLAIRTTAYRDQIQRIHSQTLPFLQGINLPLGTELTEYCSFTSEEYARRAQVEQLLSIGESIKMAYTLEENYNWYMGLVDSEADLIISDNPAQMISLGFNDICFPISPRKAIIMRVKREGARLISNDIPVNGVIHLGNQSVLMYNLLQKAQAERFLFGSERSIDITNRLNLIANKLSERES